MNCAVHGIAKIYTDKILNEGIEPSVDPIGLIDFLNNPSVANALPLIASVILLPAGQAVKLIKPLTPAIKKIGIGALRKLATPENIEAILLLAKDGKLGPYIKSLLKTIDDMGLELKITPDKIELAKKAVVDASSKIDDSVKAATTPEAIKAEAEALSKAVVPSTTTPAAVPGPLKTLSPAEYRALSPEQKAAIDARLYAKGAAVPSSTTLTPPVPSPSVTPVPPVLPRSATPTPTSPSSSVTPTPPVLPPSTTPGSTVPAIVRRVAKSAAITAAAGSVVVIGALLYGGYKLMKWVKSEFNKTKKPYGYAAIEVNEELLAIHELYSNLDKEFLDKDGRPSGITGRKILEDQGLSTTGPAVDNFIEACQRTWAPSGPPIDFIEYKNNQYSIYRMKQDPNGKIIELGNLYFPYNSEEKSITMPLHNALQYSRPLSIEKAINYLPALQKIMNRNNYVVPPSEQEESEEMPNPSNKTAYKEYLDKKYFAEFSVYPEISAAKKSKATNNTNVAYAQTIKPPINIADEQDIPMGGFETPVDSAPSYPDTFKNPPLNFADLFKAPEQRIPTKNMATATRASYSGQKQYYETQPKQNYLKTKSGLNSFINIFLDPEDQDTF